MAVALALSLLNVSTATGAEVSSIQKQLDATAADYSRLETELALTQAKRQKLESDLRKADGTISSKAVLVQKRAGYLYKHGGITSYIDQLLIAPNMGAFMRRLVYLEKAGNKDSQLVEGLRIIQSRAGDLRAQLDATAATQRTVAKGLRAKQSELESQLKGVQGSAKVKRFGQFVSFTTAISPSAFTNSWGARRSGGRRHKGTDVMAPCGAPVKAVTNGTLQNMHSGGLGGTVLYLRATGGDVFYYAHLRGYAPGMRDGVSVRAGQLIAYNGRTGNARGGACHVHFEWHPGGGRPVNPYPLLAAVR